MGEANKDIHPEPHEDSDGYDEDGLPVQEDADTYIMAPLYTTVRVATKIHLALMLKSVGQWSFMPASTTCLFLS